MIVQKEAFPYMVLLQMKGDKQLTYSLVVLIIEVEKPGKAICIRMASSRSVFYCKVHSL